MKKSSILIVLAMVAVIALVATCATTGKNEIPVGKPNALLGTWELKLYKYGFGNPSFIEYPKGRRQIELITDNYFTWVRIDEATKKITGSATGKYSFDGNNFVVNVDYGLGMDSYLGIQSNYTVKVIDDKYFLSGELVDGYQIEEVWERVK